MATKKEITKIKEQLEKDIIKTLKANPNLITSIENPSQSVRNYAINYFAKKYAHPVSFSKSIVIEENELKTNFEQDLIEKIKTEPTIIKDIPEPTTKIRNYAVAYFARKYSR